MKMEYDELIYNDGYSSPSLLQSYCPKNPFQKKNLLNPDAPTEKMQNSMMFKHWSNEEEKRISFINPNIFLNGP